MRTFNSRLLVSAVVAGALITACSSGGSGGDTSPASAVATADAAASETMDDEVVIGSSTYSREFEFYQRVEDGLERAADEAGIELLLQDARGDLAEQTAQVEDFISRGVDLITIVPIDSEAAGAVVELANDAGIPIVTHDISVTAEDVDVATHVSSDNVEGGRLAAEHMAELLGGEGQVGVINNPTITSVIDRADGFREELEANWPDIEIVATQDGESDRQAALQVTEDMLQAHPDIAGIFSVNDMMALGAYEAVLAADRTDINIIGFDATAEALEVMGDDSPFKASVAQQPEVMGEVTIDAALQVLEGSDVPDFFPVEVVLVTPDNMGDYQ